MRIQIDCLHTSLFKCSSEFLYPLPTSLNVYFVLEHGFSISGFIHPSLHQEVHSASFQIPLCDWRTLFRPLLQAIGGEIVPTRLLLWTKWSYWWFADNPSSVHKIIFICILKLSNASGRIWMAVVYNVKPDRRVSVLNRMSCCPWSHFVFYINRFSKVFILILILFVPLDSSYVGLRILLSRPCQTRILQGMVRLFSA